MMVQVYVPQLGKGPVWSKNRGFSYSIWEKVMFFKGILGDRNRSATKVGEAMGKSYP